MLVSIYSQSHCCIWSVLSCISCVSGLTTSLYLLAAVFLQIIVAVAAALSLMSFRAVDGSVLGVVAWKVCWIGIILTLIVCHGSLLPIGVVLVFVWVMDDGAWLINTYLRRLDRCIGLVVIALMHGTSKPRIHRRLISTTLKTISQHVRVLLVCLISRAYHLVRMGGVGLLAHLLGSINVLRITLYILEVHWVLRGIDELRMASNLVVSIWTTSYTLGLVYGNSFARLLRCSPGCSSWVLSWLHDEAVLRDVLNDSIVEKSLVLHGQLLELDLLLHFHCVLLLRREVVTTVQHLAVLVLVVKCTVSRTDLHGTTIGVLLNVGIRIRVFARKESLLGCSFSVIDHSLIWAGAFTLGKMNNVFETVGLVCLLLVSIDLLVHLVLLLTSQRLLELKLLL